MDGCIRCSDTGYGSTVWMRKQRINADGGETKATHGAQETKETSQGETSAAAEERKNVNDDGTVNNPEQVAVDANKLVMWSLFSGGDGSFMTKMIEEYNGTNPTKQVQSIMLVWADYYTKLQTAVAAGKGPDMGISHASSPCPN